MKIKNNKDGSITVEGKCTLPDAVGAIAKRFLESAKRSRRLATLAGDVGNHREHAALIDDARQQFQRGQVYVNAMQAAPPGSRGIVERLDVQSTPRLEK